MDQEVEEVSFLPGEVILNKKAVYEPTKGQRFRQIVCSKGWAVGILLLIGTVLIAVAVIAAFARPAYDSNSSGCAIHNQDADSTADAATIKHEEPQTYIATNGEPFPWKLLRLPKSIIPESYKIFLHPFLNESYFIGNIQMSLRVVQKTDFIVFHSKNLNISNVTVFQVQKNRTNFSALIPLEVIKELEYPRNDQYYIGLKAILDESSDIQIQMDFKGIFEGPNQVKGFYRSSYTAFGQERYIASTQFEASDARRAFPCFDEPELKATFIMSIVREKHQISLFNMPLRGSPAPYHNQLMVDEYKETVKMSTYLVAFVICDFKNISRITKSNVNVNLYAPEDKIHMGFLALNATVTLLDFYNDYFGTPYPLPKQDLVAVPNMAAGAMENWGLILFRESALLYDPKLSTASAKEGIITTVAHELAHQWFGNLVTMKWWDDLWLNEGFATFVENTVGTNTFEPDLRKSDSCLLDYLTAMSQDSLVYSHPIAVTVNDPIEIDSVFDKISYDKGSAVINMLKGFLKEDKFKQGVNNYLMKHKLSNAETRQLWESFQEVSNLPPHLTVSKVMDTWTKQMGFPVVTVTRKDNILQLSQKRYLLSSHSNRMNTKDKNLESPFGYKWIIPFTYKTSSDVKDEKLVWMSGDTETAEVKDDSVKWIKANVDTQGFYRVNYDKAGWQSIIKQLNEDHTVFSVKDRIGLIEDVFNLARTGLTDYGTALDLTTYLINETDYFVLDNAISHFHFLRGRLFLEDEYDALNSYIMSLIKSNVDEDDWNKKPNPVEEYKQSLVISTLAALQYQPVIQKATKMFEFWKANKELLVSNGLRYTVFSQGVKHGTKQDWDHVFQKYANEVVPSEGRILLLSLTASQDARLLQILLKYALNSTKIKPQHADEVLSHVGSEPSGQLFAWQFLREHYDSIYERYGNSVFLWSSIIKHTISSFNSQFEYDEVVAFFKDKKIGTAKLSLEQSIEYIENHINWAKDYMTTVKKWLTEHSKHLTLK